MKTNYKIELVLLFSFIFSIAAPGFTSIASNDTRVDVEKISSSLVVRHRGSEVLDDESSNRYQYLMSYSGLQGKQVYALQVHVDCFRSESCARYYDT